MKLKLLPNEILLAVGISLVAGCAAEPDGAGNCSLSCGDAKIGSREQSIVGGGAGGSEFTIECPNVPDGQTQELGIVNLTWTVLKAAAGLGEGRQIPIPNISIRPLLFGPSGRTRSTEVGNEGFYEGVATPQEEWCSDSCGVISLSVQPVCYGGQETQLTVALRSGSLVSESYTLTASAAAEQASGTGLVEGKAGEGGENRPESSEWSFPPIQTR